MQNCCAVRGAVGAPCVALRSLFYIYVSLLSSFYESRTKGELIGHRLMTESYAKSGGGDLAFGPGLSRKRIGRSSRQHLGGANTVGSAHLTSFALNTGGGGRRSPL